MMRNVKSRNKILNVVFEILSEEEELIKSSSLIDKLINRKVPRYKSLDSQRLSMWIRCDDRFEAVKINRYNYYKLKR